MAGDGIEERVRRLDGRGYKAYKSLEGTEYTARGVRVRIVRVQGDPFATPSIIEARVRVEPQPRRGEEPPLEDLLARRLSRLAPRYSLKDAGEGSSGRIIVPRLPPVIARRAMAVIEDGVARVRLRAGLPARRRRILGDEAATLLLDRIPRLVAEAARLGSEARLWQETWRNQEHIRRWLQEARGVAFVADGSILPRKCGGCWEPLEGAVPFESPSSLRQEVEVPHGDPIPGMLVPRGLTVIAGPAFHGKTTLVEALYEGVWNHIPGDGREYVITDRGAVYVESENGRWTSCVDLRPWIRSLPGGRDTGCFTTGDASGATSLFASIQEYLEAGATALLIDEDRTATNAIHRDRWVEEYTGKKTITTITEMAPALKKAGVSIVIVASGAMELLAAADTIIVMDEYRAKDASWYREKAREKAETVEGLEYERPAPRRVRKPVIAEKPKLRGRILEARGLRDRVNLEALRQLPSDNALYTAALLALRIAGSGGAGLVEEAERLASLARGARWEHLAGRAYPPELEEARSLDIAAVASRLPGPSGWLAP